MSDLPTSPSAERNKQPILDVLRRTLGPQGRALEIAAGTGQHAVWFAAGLSPWLWQPSEADARMLPLLSRRIEEAALPNLQAPVLLDVTAPQWPAQGPAFGREFDAVFCANMLHIAPWPACAALMDGAARHLRPGGLLLTYGPYFEEGLEVPSNQAFDEDLRARNPAWGIRRLDDVVAQAARAGLQLRERHAMPANNLLLVFAR